MPFIGDSEEILRSLLKDGGKEKYQNNSKYADEPSVILYGFKCRCGWMQVKRRKVIGCPNCGESLTGTLCFMKNEGVVTFDERGKYYHGQ